MPTEKLDNLLNRNGDAELAALVRRARQLGELAATLAAALPPALSADIIAANVRDDGELVVVCRSPARAARMRYESGTLLAAARSAGMSVSRLVVRVGGG